ncbi:MAG TPA: peptide chain release factor N(5)-glutamine methyltransferase [Gemmatimonadaceae bacterium]|nr:peptide chain release factor N(5)-glutamine methyltransferase [Gemmatimonadaceae bacterium]
MTDVVVALPVARRIGALVDEIAAVLADAGLAEARAEARDLVAVLLDVPRFWPSLHRDEPAGETLRTAALAAAAKRARGSPFAYAAGRAAFRHLTLEVDERVLIPRQETERLVELLLTLPAAGGGAGAGLAIDIGTGSGAIALALATEGSFERIIATDVSLDALVVARDNADRLAGALRAPVEMRHGSFLAPVRTERARLIVSNPPYIALSEAPELPPAVRDWEPPIALFGGGDGMCAVRAIIADAAGVLEPGGVLALEVDARRASLAAAAAAADGRYDEIRVLADLAGRERYLMARARTTARAH